MCVHARVGVYIYIYIIVLPTASMRDQIHGNNFQENLNTLHSDTD